MLQLDTDRDTHYPPNKNNLLEKEDPHRLLVTKQIVWRHYDVQKLRLDKANNPIVINNNLRMNGMAMALER